MPQQKHPYDSCFTLKTEPCDSSFLIVLRNDKDGEYLILDENQHYLKVDPKDSLEQALRSFLSPTLKHIYVRDWGAKFSIIEECSGLLEQSRLDLSWHHFPEYFDCCEMCTADKICKQAKYVLQIDEFLKIPL